MSYMAQFVTSATPLSTFFTAGSRLRTLKVAPALSMGVDQLSLPRLRQAWYAFSSLLTVSTTQQFLCSECGRYPDTLIMDGHALGLRQTLLADVDRRRRVADAAAAAEGRPLLVGSRHQDRMLIRDATTRDLVRRFATGEDARRRRLPLVQAEYAQLLEGLLRHCPQMRAVVRSALDRNFSEHLFVAKESYSLLLRECARNCPVAGILPLLGDAETRRCVIDIAEGESFFVFVKLSKN